MPENKAGGVGDVSWIRQNVWRVDSLSELGNDDALIKKIVPAGEGQGREGIRNESNQNLLDVSGDELGHLEHGHLSLATEDSLELGISIDVGLLVFVLETVLFDVVPELFGELTAGSRLGTDDSGQDFIWLHWLHESWVGFASGGCGRFFCHRAAMLAVYRPWVNTSCRVFQGLLSKMSQGENLNEDFPKTFFHFREEP